MNGRLLSIDITRIVGLLLVLLQHTQGTNLLPSWVHNISINYLPYIFYIDYGRIGVWLFIFASGASLGLNHSEFSGLSDVKDFYKKRILRIYPSYWVGLLLSLLVFNWVIPSLTLVDIARWFSGFQQFFATSSIEVTKINITYWFIGVVVSLYFLYPLLLYAINKHPYLSIMSFFAISLASRCVMYWIFPMYGSGWDWFPPCRFFNFALGIFLVKKGLFPKATSTPAIAFLSVMSFYIYLVHFPIMCATNYPNIGIVFFVVLTILFAFLLYGFDRSVQNLFSRRTNMLRRHSDNIESQT